MFNIPLPVHDRYITEVVHVPGRNLEFILVLVPFVPVPPSPILPLSHYRTLLRMRISCSRFSLSITPSKVLLTQVASVSSHQLRLATQPPSLLVDR